MLNQISLFWGSLTFQFLIGAMKESNGEHNEIWGDKFQFLIGAMKALMVMTSWN